MVPGEDKKGLRHKARHNEALRLCVLWDAAAAHGGLDRRSGAAKLVSAWRRISRFPLKPGGISDLVHCCWMYGCALMLREGHRSSSPGEANSDEKRDREGESQGKGPSQPAPKVVSTAAAEKDCRRRARQLAKEARDLECSLSTMVRDASMSRLLEPALFRPDEMGSPVPRFPGLRSVLLNLASEIEGCLTSRVVPGRSLETQHKIALDMRRAALCGDHRLGVSGMVNLGKTEGGRIDWKLLADFVNLLSRSCEQPIDADSLKRDYRDIKKARNR
jgi:hypothetical protein